MCKCVYLLHARMGVLVSMSGKRAGNRSVNEILSLKPLPRFFARYFIHS